MSSEVKKIIWGILKEAALRQILRAVPFLGLPIIHSIFAWIFNLLTEKIFVEVDRYITFFEIDLKTAEEKKLYQEALEKFKNAPEEDRENERKKLEESLANLIRLRRM